MPATAVSADQFAKRRENLRKILRKKKLPALLVQNEHNVHYLTGFGGEDSILLIGVDFEILLTDSRFVTQLVDECPGLELYVRKTSKGYETMDKSIAIVLGKYDLASCGFEGDTMTVGFFERIKEQVKNVELVGTRGWIEELRMIKDKFEIEETRRAVRYAENAFLKVTRSLHPDMTEFDVAHAIEAVVRQQGGKGHSFEPIVATGPRAALPHGRAGHTKISTAGFILIDWGAMATRYMSDMTRIVRTGKVSPKIEKIYPVVLKAQLAAIAKIRPGAVCGDVDSVARKVIADAGYGKNFGHGLGHGLGLQVHEQPRFSIGSKQVLQAGMIVTVEPGIYFPGIGGVRIEDDILVTKSGFEVLGSLTKTWEETKVDWAGTRKEWAA